MISFGIGTCTLDVLAILFGTTKTLIIPLARLKGVPTSCEAPLSALSPQLQPSVLSLGYNQETVYSSLVQTQSVLFITDTLDANQDPKKTLKKHSIFNRVSKAADIMKNYPHGVRITSKRDPRVIIFLLRKLVFAIHSIRNPCFESTNHQGIPSKNDPKSDLETSPNKT